MSAGVRISLPAALLVLGVALSCSTACLTSAVVQVAQANHGYNVRITKARQQLQQNIRTRSGGEAPLPVSENPASIQRALQLALPVRQYGQPSIDPDTVEVTAATMPDGRPLYLITVTGDFYSVPFYGDAFMEYANSLRRGIAAQPVFRVKLVRAVNGKRFTEKEQELR